MMRRTTVPAGLALGFAVTALAAPAFAEGQFESYMANWLPGISTRTWTDANKDNVSTTFSAKQCTFETGVSTKSITMELNRLDTWTPDEHYGNKDLACTSANSLKTASWGDHGAGKFNFTLKKVNGSDQSYGGHVGAKYVRVTY